MQVNYNTIETSINDTVRHVRNNDIERAAVSFATYINEAPKAPGFARITQNVALENSGRVLDNEVFEGRMALNDAKKTHINTSIKLNQFWGICKEEADSFKDSFKKMYPKTWKKRLSIEAFLHETMGEVKPASDFKGAKKIMAFARKFSSKLF